VAADSSQTVTVDIGAGLGAGAYNTPNHYTSATLTESVAAGRSWSSDITATFAASGWYDLTVTVSADSSWSQRFTGHLENGLTSITG
jgi:phospholipase C